MNSRDSDKVPERPPTWLAGRIASLGYAGQGLITLLKTQPNARIHLFAALLVLSLGLVLGVEAYEWALLLLAIALVWISEALNTALEFLCDLVSPDYHPLIKQAKDVAAAAVLLSAMFALALGALVFFPYLQALLAAS